MADMQRKPKGAKGTPDVPAAFLRPLVAVDLVIVTILDAIAKILLIQRKDPPYQGQWALPGGFLRSGTTPDDPGEDLEDAVRRELAEETGLPPSAVFFEQLHTFGHADRDPRTRVISVAYYALVRPDLAPFAVAGGDAANAAWHPVADLPPLAFDHADMVAMALQRLRAKIDSSSIAFELVPATFTIAELRAVYDVLKGVPQDPGNFRRKFQALIDEGIIEQAPGKRITTSKPAKVYRFRRLEA